MFNTNQPTDPIAPNWTRVMIGIEEYWGDGPQPGDALGARIKHLTYHVRFFSLAAPDIAGLYHFKIYF